jgi:peptide chain release factor 1
MCFTQNLKDIKEMIAETKEEEEKIILSE